MYTIPYDVYRTDAHNKGWVKNTTREEGIDSKLDFREEPRLIIPSLVGWPGPLYVDLG